jgi:hypothetical protein
MPIGADLSAAEYFFRVPSKTAQKDLSLEIVAEKLFVQT